MHKRVSIATHDYDIIVVRMATTPSKLSLFMHASRSYACCFIVKLPSGVEFLFRQSNCAGKLHAIVATVSRTVVYISTSQKDFIYVGC